MKVFSALSGSLIVAFGVYAYWGEQPCTRIPPRHWLSPLEVEIRLRDAQLRMEAVRTTSNRCYETVARDVYGMRHIMVIDPADGSILSSERKPASIADNQGNPAAATGADGRRATPQVLD
ncbi:MAG TPA: hypothetical protein PLQ11_05515 [Beijerinckiaceae bacterium]|nr:hypothetical protein [Beijerinckiaceae bacterium]